MTRQQKGKGHKRKRSWHRRFNAPDDRFRWATRRLDRAIERARKLREEKRRQTEDGDR